ncbi:MAG: SRPBCC family protein [Pedobacter sp.]|nr:SRPBCC family protein [Pedobacter sp.]
MEKGKKIKVAATTAVPLAKVWEAWNTPADIMKWNTPDPSWHTPSSTNDLRVGGKFNNRMEAKDGSFGFDFEGVYDEVDHHQKITYTLGDGRQATTLFAEKDGQTTIETSFDPETQNAPEFQQQGWQSILNNFIKYVETKE